jgi:protein TonB
MRRQETIPAPRGRTGGAAWRGAGASLLLHFFVGAAMIAALSGPPKAPPQVVDLTLVPPEITDRGPIPRVFTGSEPTMNAKTAVLQEPPAFSAAPTVANPPDVTAPANASDPPAKWSAPATGSPHSFAAALVPTIAGPVRTVAGSASGTSGAESLPVGDFAWIRDAIQHAIAYPATARRMGWEGKVLVAFQLLSDGSVRDVRVVQGSGHAALDRGAIEAVRNASPFHRSSVEAEVITPVVYRLTIH